MNDWSDRWVDAGLQELHGSRPPDLSARVVLALQAPPAGPLPTLQPRPPGMWRHLLLAAALVLAGIAAGALLPRTRAVGDQIVQLDLQVRTGALECVQIESAGVRRSHHVAGERAVFVSRVGNRLLAAEPCRFQVGPFGELATGPATELEVRSMTVNWKQGIVLGSSLTVAVVAGVVTWHSLSQSGTAKAGEVVRLDAADGSNGSGLLAENAQLRERIRQLEQQSVDLQAAMVREPAADGPPVEEPPPPPPEEPVPAKPGAVFTDDAHADLLAALDWQMMGEVTHEMGPMLVELAEAMEKDGKLPMDVIAKVQALNSKLVAQVPALMASGMPGSGPNGAYTHPLISANILAKTLDAAGLAMDAGQRAEIAGLVRSFSAEAQAVADSVHDLDLERMASEVETKDRFFREVSSRLTPEQYRVMFPDGADRFEGTSLFHSSLFTRPFTEGVPASNPAEFARSVSFKLGEQIGFDDAASSQVRAIVERMSGSPELWQHKATNVETELHMLRGGRTQAAMRNQIAIMREIAQRVPMTAEQKQKFLSMKYLLVPLPR